MTGSGRSEKASIAIRRAKPDDAPAVVALDQATTGQNKPDYWRDMIAQFSGAQADRRAFLVAESGGRLVGFISGEIRSF